jgi:hypothetical protein
MGRAARSRNDDLHAALRGFVGELGHPLRRAMRGDNLAFIRYAELVE